MSVEFEMQPGAREREGDMVCEAVAKCPGMTAQWYVKKLKTDIRREGWLYNAFYRTVRARRIVGVHSPETGRVAYYLTGQAPGGDHNGRPRRP